MPLASVKMKEDDQSNIEPSAGASVSAFLGKLWKMVEDPKTDHLISWGKTGNSFVIKNQTDFAKTILPNYYKHNNIASFIRQLNMYGFHKIISTTSGALDSSDNDEIEFTHPRFVRGHPYLLEHIKRKMNNPKENFFKADGGVQSSESMKRVLNDIRNLKGKQEQLGTQLCAVKQENEILWRELSLLRQKHAAQQNVLNKLIRFLVSLAQPSSNHGLVKRRLVPLMLKDAASSSRGKSSSIYDTDHVYTVKKREENSPGPTIHEIHASDLPENLQIIEAPILEEDTPIMIENEIVSSPASIVSNPEIQSPEPVPAALLLPTKTGEKRIQTVYLKPRQAISSHLLIPQTRPKGHHSPEYLIPDKMDNPLLELVQETEPEDPEDEYITIVTSDGTELEEDLPIALATNRAINSNKKRMSNRRRGRKEAVPMQMPIKRNPPKKIDRRKRVVAPVTATSVIPATASTKNSAGGVGNSNDFLFDLELNNYSEPLVEIRTPSSTATHVDENVETVSAAKSSEVTSEVPITVEDMLNIPTVENGSSLNTCILPDQERISPISRISPITSPIASANNVGSSVFNVGEGVTSFPDNCSSAMQPTDAQPVSNVCDSLRERIDDCKDNVQNMRIACTDGSASLTKAYVNDLTQQLDSMQFDIDNLKEVIHNEGLTVDVNALLNIFNQDPLDYAMPGENSNDFHKEGEKIEGNELISSQPVFDFSDIFSQNDWSQPSTPLHPMDAEYCNLNTPQIERTEEGQPMYPPPSKKIKS